MDAGRFGKALGVGAREAAKAAMKAAEAAAAPNPTPAQSRPQVMRPTTPRSTIPQAVRQTATTTENLKRGGKRFGEAMWGPFAKLSGVLLLEVTGVLFALFAAVAGMEAWKGRGAFQSASGTTRPHEVLAILMFVFFAYLTLSNFLRASRRSRK